MIRVAAALATVAVVLGFFLVRSVEANARLQLRLEAAEARAQHLAEAIGIRTDVATLSDADFAAELSERLSARPDD